MKDKERITELEKELAAKDEQIQGLLKKLKEQEALGVGKGKSKSRVQAEEGLKMLEAGPISVAQLKTLNDKYPGDVVYYIRTLLKRDVKTVRKAGGSSLHAARAACYLPRGAGQGEGCQGGSREGSKGGDSARCACSGSS